MKLDSLHALYVKQLQDLYSAETQLVEALPLIEAAVKNRDLTESINDHFTQTENQVQRLNTILERHDARSDTKYCTGMAGLLNEARDFITISSIDPEVLDAGVIAALQRVEHYEIAAYGTVCTYAEEMGQIEDLQLLRESLAEEKQTDQQLSVLAERSINIKAIT